MIPKQSVDGYVYAVADPDSLRPVYVGETVTNITSRLHMHISVATNQFNRKSFVARFPVWVREIVSNGRIPIVFLLETVSRTGDPTDDKRKRLDAERFWIKNLNLRGYDLLNADKADVARKQWARKTPEQRAEHLGRVRKHFLDSRRRKKNKRGKQD